MLAELMVAGRGIATAAGAFGSTVSNRHPRTVHTMVGRAAGAAFTGGGNGLVGVTKRAVGNAAASSATGTGSGLSSIIGGAMFGSSLASGGKFATSVIGAVAKGRYILCRFDYRRTGVGSIDQLSWLLKCCGE